MTPNLKILIPPIDEAGRAKRIQFEHKLLNRLLNDLDDPELDQAELRNTIRDYCELKKQDNLHEKNIAQLAIADARLAFAEARLARAETRLSRRHQNRANQGLPFGALSDSPLVSPEQSRAVPSPGNGESAYFCEPDNSLARDSHLAPTPAGIPSCVPTDPQFAIDDSDFDPDVDPEWSLAPWGRRRNGKPRTEKEYRTILNRTIRDVYGLGSSEDIETSRPAPLTNAPPTTRVPASSIAAAAEIRHPAAGIESSDAPHQSFDLPHPTSDLPSPRSPPARREVSPFCNPDAPFLPKPTNPWYDF